MEGLVPLPFPASSGTIPLMQCTVNGRPMDLPDACSVADLLDRLGVKRENVAVEVNLDVVPRAVHAERRLKAADIVEVVSFVGGG